MLMPRELLRWGNGIYEEATERVSDPDVRSEAV